MINLNITSEHNFGDIVYLKTDSDQRERIVLEIKVTATGAVTYNLGCGITDSWHYAIEISTEKDFVKATSG